MLKRSSIFVVFAVFITILGACSEDSGSSNAENSGEAKAESTEKITLQVGHVFGSNHPWTISLEGLAEDVLEATDGNVEIEVYSDSQLGGDREVAEGIQLGTVDMGLFGTGALQSLDERLIVEELPYAWPTREHAYEAIDGEFGEALSDILSELDMTTVSWWESGYRHITNSKQPINEPKDLEGIKLRVPEAQLRIDTFEELGALPTPMALDEVFYGLQQNVIDGQENPLPTIYDSKFYEVQDHLALTGHIWGSAVLVIGQDKWDEIPEDYQEIIMEKADEWKEKEREMIQEQDEEVLEELEEEDIEVTEPDQEVFQEEMQSLWTEYEDVFGEELIDLVRKYSTE